jgi:hypothetical protein
MPCCNFGKKTAAIAHENNDHVPFQVKADTDHEGKWWKRLGSPRYIMAPTVILRSYSMPSESAFIPTFSDMQNDSGLAFRLMARRHSVELTCTEAGDSSLRQRDLQK